MTTADLWTAFGARLRRFILQRVRHEHDADDILQDVFARIQTELGGVRSEETLEAWLFQVTRHAVIDHFRRRKNVALDADPAEPEPAPDVDRELASCLTPMMERLDDAAREALRLTDLEGLPHRDLAARLGLSVTGAKSRVQRARKRLKELLLDCCQVETDRRGHAVEYAPRDPSCSCA